MSAIIDEIRTTQAETIIKHENKLRRDKNAILWVVHNIHENIKKKVSDYYYAKDIQSMTFKFVLDLSTQDKYTITMDVLDGKSDMELTQPEYRAVVDLLLNEGFKVSQCEADEEFYSENPNPIYSKGIRHVRKLTVEW